MVSQQTQVCNADGSGGRMRERARGSFSRAFGSRDVEMVVESVKYMLMAQDMERAVRFYCDVIGLEVQFQSPQWTELAFGNAIVALHGGGQGKYERTGLSLQVRDIASACKEIEAGGGKVALWPQARPGEPIKLAEVVDTEGNAFSLTQYVG
jgi:predicted enzyme related to lactoylglutathione lyase